jgi:hypothetical protein
LEKLKIEIEKIKKLKSRKTLKLEIEKHEKLKLRKSGKMKIGLKK